MFAVGKDLLQFAVLLVFSYTYTIQQNQNYQNNPAVIDYYTYSYGQFKLGNGTLVGDMMFTEDDLKRLGINDTEAGNTDTPVGDEVSGNEKRDITHKEKLRWRVPVPYVFQQLTHRGMLAVKLAFKEFREKTCITFVPRTNEEDYLNFIGGSGCWSWIGRHGGRQYVSLDRRCEFKRIVVHEIMHALGFYHEQNRPDRDDYIKVNYENMFEGKAIKYQFHKAAKALTLGIRYDYESVMHYWRKDFSKNGKNVLEAKNDPNRILGVHDLNAGMSELDAEALNELYCRGRQHKYVNITSCPKTHPYAFCGGVYCCEYDDACGGSQMGLPLSCADSAQIMCPECPCEDFDFGYAPSMQMWK